MGEGRVPSWYRELSHISSPPPFLLTFHKAAAARVIPQIKGRFDSEDLSVPRKLSWSYEHFGVLRGDSPDLP
jgi:hypothetical protein